MSAVTGTSTTRAMRAMAANISSAGVASPSAQPSAPETPALVVATTGNPASTTARAVAASQALGKTRGSAPEWSDRSRSAASASVLIRSRGYGSAYPRRIDPRGTPLGGPGADVDVLVSAASGARRAVDRTVQRETGGRQWAGRRGRRRGPRRQG